MSCPIFYSWWGNKAEKGKGTGPLSSSWVGKSHFRNSFRDFFGAAKHCSVSLPISVLLEDVNR